VVAWGGNYYGQTNVPPGLTNVVAIAAHGFNNLALRADGTVVAWGWNYYGQSSVPANLTNVVAIASGDIHSLALVGESVPCVTKQPRGLTTPAGTSATFKINASGTAPLSFQWQFEGAEIGGATNDSLTISNVTFGNVGRFAVVVTNSSGSVTSDWATLTIGPIIAWGRNGTYEISAPPGLTNTVEIAAGYYHNMTRLTDGTLQTWGDHRSPQPPGISNVVAIAGGLYFSLAALQDGSVVGWGDGSSGQTNPPANVSNVVALAAGWSHSLALQKDGRVAAWGPPLSGGAQTNVPTDLKNAVAIAAGDFHSVALRSDGTVVSFGNVTLPAGLSNIVAIAARGGHSLALKSDGTVVPWGSGSFGLNTPPPGLSNVVAIGCTTSDNVALRSDGSLVLWGDPQLGQNAIPAGLQNVVAVSGGSSHILALTGDGRPYITVQPFNQTVPVSSTVTFNVLATGAQPLTYQWQHAGTNLDGATNSTLTLSNVPLGAAGEYRCIVSNALDSVTSAAATLTVLRAPLRFDLAAAGLQLTNDGFHMRLAGLVGEGSIVIYASSNLLNWEAIFTNPPSVGTLDFIDPSAVTLPMRFYRAVEIP
jgi:alpha-tubulin suppressor-like RCC1 family protein